MLHITFSNADKGPDTFQSVVSLIGSLAWPLAILIIMFGFRKQIAGLLENLSELAWGDKKAVFNRKIESIEQAIEAVESDPEAQPKPKSDASKRGLAMDEMPPGLSPHKQLADAQALLQAAKLSGVAPSAAILDAYKLVSNEVEKLAIKHGLGRTKPYMGRTYNTAKSLQDRDIFNTQIMVLLAELRKVRNLAAHDNSIDAEGALRYIELVGRFLRLIEDL